MQSTIELVDKGAGGVEVGRVPLQGRDGVAYVADVSAHPQDRPERGSIAVESVANQYETVAASQTNQVLGATGAIGDYLQDLIVVPTSTSPGAVSIKDGSGGASITVFAGGASSVADLKPFAIPCPGPSVSGGWYVTTGAALSVIARGRFS